MGRQQKEGRERETACPFWSLACFRSITVCPKAKFGIWYEDNTAKPTLKVCSKDYCEKVLYDRNRMSRLALYPMPLVCLGQYFYSAWQWSFKVLGLAFILLSTGESLIGGARDWTCDILCTQLGLCGWPLVPPVTLPSFGESDHER